MQRDARENPQKNLIYQIQRRNKTTSKGNKPETHFPRIVFAKDIVPTDHPGVTDHVEAFTKQICEVIVGKSLVIICISSALVVVAWAEPSPTSNHIVSHIPREPVQSSAIAKIGYSKRRHILEIEFVNGAVYRYFDIPLSAHRDLMSAESSALLRLQYQETLSFGFGSAAAKGTALDAPEIAVLPRRIFVAR